MKFRALPFWFSILGFAVLAAIVLFWPQPASAQCGSQASSCKNCHEVQGQLPVNNDGNGWHTSHAFGDFCANCHAGNVQVTDKDAAHAGMVKPLEDIKTNCGACHPDDLQERAQVYASILGVTVVSDSGSSSSGGGAAGGESAAPTTPEPSAPPADSAVVVNPPEVIDFNQRYEQAVSGTGDVNWGDVTLAALIVIILIGGGGFVYWNERRLRGLGPSRPASEPAAAAQAVSLNAYPPEVVALLPLVAQLNPVGLRALKLLLQKPDEASELLHSLSRLDPELVHRIRMLDRDSRALLMGLAGD